MSVKEADLAMQTLAELILLVITNTSEFCCPVGTMTLL